MFQYIILRFNFNILFIVVKMSNKIQSNKYTPHILKVCTQSPENTSADSCLMTKNLLQPAAISAMLMSRHMASTRPIDLYWQNWVNIAGTTGVHWQGADMYAKLKVSERKNERSLSQYRIWPRIHFLRKYTSCIGCDIWFPAKIWLAIYLSQSNVIKTQMREMKHYLFLIVFR